MLGLDRNQTLWSSCLTDETAREALNPQPPDARACFVGQLFVLVAAVGPNHRNCCALPDKHELVSWKQSYSSNVHTFTALC